MSRVTYAERYALNRGTQNRYNYSRMAKPTAESKSEPAKLMPALTLLATPGASGAGAAL